MSRGSTIPAGMVLSGEIRGAGDLVIAGAVEGPVHLEGHLVIEAGASVRGEVKARSMVIRGTLMGPAIADETIRLESGAKMVGDARAERVSVIEGALLRGRITMTGAAPARRSSAGTVTAAGVPAPAPVPFADDRTNRYLRPQDLQLRRSEPAAPLPREAAPAREAISPREAVPAREAISPREAVPAREAAPPRESVSSREPVPREPMAPPEPAPLAARPRDRRPPEPVIPGVGRQRARRKDGGVAP